MIIINLRFDPESAFNEFGDRMTGSEKVSVANAATGQAGQAIAEKAKERMSEMLKPGHKYRVGASGAASENFEVSKTQDSAGYVEWVVSEGGATIANPIIRQGLKGGTWPYKSALIEWAANKGIDLYPYDRARKKYVSFTTRAGKRVSFHAKRRKRTRDIDRAAFALARSINDGGTSRTPSSGRQGSDWMVYTPREAGRGRFDYVKWTVKQGGYFSNAVMGVYARHAVNLIVRWLASGQKSYEGFRMFTGGSA